jgi:hypothetical protein
MLWLQLGCRRVVLGPGANYLQHWRRLQHSRQRLAIEALLLLLAQLSVLLPALLLMLQGLCHVQAAPHSLLLLCWRPRLLHCGPLLLCRLPGWQQRSPGSTRLRCRNLRRWQLGRRQRQLKLRQCRRHTSHGWKRHV